MIKLKEITNRLEEHTPIGESWTRHYAVILPLVELDDGEGPRILYEVRAQKLDRQPGEVCFPGGEIEPEETPMQAALRETREELGIAASEISVIAPLDLYHPPSDIVVYPFLAEIRQDVLTRLSLNEC
jgi:8-oxo-dGTP pyrophosphatase MutT (NUDIX family)